jgi:hypothetical protein
MGTARLTRTPHHQPGESASPKHDDTALRLRGLADLIGPASCNGADLIVISDDAGYFISTTLADLAERLEPAYRPEPA